MLRFQVTCRRWSSGVRRHYQGLKRAFAVCLLAFWLANVWLTFSAAHWLFAGRCAWPGSSASSSRLLVVADPQLSDRHSQDYLADSAAPLVRAFELATDSYMQRAFRAAVRVHRPDGVLLLGDLMDFARLCRNDEQYERLRRRFAAIFLDETELLPHATSVDVAQLAAADKPWLVTAAGNHDVGYWEDHADMLVWAERFVHHFGPLNRLLRLPSGFAVAVVASTHLEPAATPAVLHAQATRFLHRFAANSSDDVVDSAPSPLLLVSHVPLARTARCWQSTRRISDTVRRGYRNTLSRRESDQLLRAFRPAAVLSGDAHFSCRVEHAGAVPEFTVPTFSWVQGEIWPGYALVALSVDADTQRPVFDYRECTLPPQLPIYLWHAAAAALSLLAAVVVNVAVAWRNNDEFSGLVAFLLLDVVLFTPPIAGLFLWLALTGS